MDGLLIFKISIGLGAIALTLLIFYILAKNTIK